MAVKRLKLSRLAEKLTNFNRQLFKKKDDFLSDKRGQPKLSSGDEKHACQKFTNMEAKLRIKKSS